MAPGQPLRLLPALALSALFPRPSSAVRLQLSPAHGVAEVEAEAQARHLEWSIDLAVGSALADAAQRLQALSLETFAPPDPAAAALRSGPARQAEVSARHGEVGKPRDAATRHGKAGQRAGSGPQAAAANGRKRLAREDSAHPSTAKHVAASRPIAEAHQRRTGRPEAKHTQSRNPTSGHKVASSTHSPAQSVIRSSATRQGTSTSRPAQSSMDRAPVASNSTAGSRGIALERLRDGMHSAVSRSVGHRERPVWLFGAHHKTGTWLISRLAKFQGAALEEPMCSISSLVGPCGLEGRYGPSCWSEAGPRNWFDCHMTAASLTKVKEVASGSLRAVHIVRDPVAVVISGYVYHTRSNDLAPIGLQGSDLARGVELEAKAALTHSLPDMLGAYRRGQAEERLLVVRLEDFMASSASFDATVHRIYNFTVGDVLDEVALKSLEEHAAREDLRRRPYTDHSTSITDPQLKREASAALSSLPTDLLKQLLWYRGALGYA